MRRTKRRFKNEEWGNPGAQYLPWYSILSERNGDEREPNGNRKQDSHSTILATQSLRSWEQPYLIDVPGG